MPRSLCVFCGSSPGTDPRHKALAAALGKALAQHKHRLVYGGGGLGLMGAVAKTAHHHGGDVLGIIPEFLGEAEKTLTEVNHVFVPDMHERKIRMFEESDGFIVLPGGVGTLEEVIEVLSWLRMNLHQKPIVFLSDTGYWDVLIKVFGHIIEEGFSSKTLADDIIVADSPKAAFALIEDRILNPLPRKALNLSLKDKV